MLDSLVDQPAHVSIGIRFRRERSVEYYFVLCRCERQRCQSVIIACGHSLLLTR